MNSDPALLCSHKHHKEKINSIALSHSGTQLASAGSDSIVYLFNRSKQTSTKLVGHSGELSRVKFSHSD